MSSEVEMDDVTLGASSGSGGSGSSSRQRRPAARSDTDGGYADADESDLAPYDRRSVVDVGGGGVEGDDDDAAPPPRRAMRSRPLPLKAALTSGFLLFVGVVFGFTGLGMYLSTGMSAALPFFIISGIG